MCKGIIFMLLMPEEGGKKSRTEVIFKTIFQEHFPKLEKICIWNTYWKDSPGTWEKPDDQFWDIV